MCCPRWCPLGYDSLAIGDGAMASVALERLLYCALDTLGMVKLLQRLRELAIG